MKVLVGLFVLVFVSFTGCKSNLEVGSAKEVIVDSYRFDVDDDVSSALWYTYILTDKETGVGYLFISRFDGGACIVKLESKTF